ncbi:DUF599 domain-containing protein [Endozoicomonas sp. G2_1]|uniref:DUF599 domain-containing protein n=1 Tax=Endozoicomonas sp. G2_1 TaxID=2821091 RepID=UPI001ADA8B0C|nr:DUF599 domain-containing protein [Endozoicomonas sp. G2_1]MBO9490802.1 DUF599 domain-containing protein [Endozoicomonas sp. G2_1]
MPFSVLDIIVLLLFLFCWIGYTYFARKKAKTTDCIARSLHQHRIHWMYEIITRDIRVGEAALLANLERNIAFFASSSLLVIAGILTLFAQVEKLEEIIASIPMAEPPHHVAIQLKLSLLAFIFVLAFFNFTWSMRQYGFLNVMIGAAPIDESGLNKNLHDYAKQMAIVQDQAAHAYNYGLRAYYFSLAVLCWFYHPALFVLASVFVVYTLYIREFKSKAVRAITTGQHFLNIERKQRFPDWCEQEARAKVHLNENDKTNKADQQHQPKDSDND